MERYTKIYNTNELYKLTKKEILLLFELCKRVKLGSYNDTNLVILSSRTRKDLCSLLGLKNVRSLSQYLHALKDKGFLKVEAVNQFRLNPNILGRGTEQNIAIARRFYDSNIEIDDETGEIKDE